ncbi:MAG: glycosyltransferase [Chitinophagales bacterium]|nr:glycosyltransferase [Chitinophagales bacterium]
MINRVLQKIRFEKNAAKAFEETVAAFADARNKSAVVAVCPQNTQQHWMGIKQAAQMLFPQNLVVLPQQYSNSLLTPRLLEKLGSKIGEMNFDKVVFNGFPPYFELLFRSINKANTTTKLYLLFAGPASEYSSEVQRNNIQLAANLVRSKILYKVGFNKKGLAAAFKQIYGVHAGEYMVKNYVAPDAVAKQAPVLHQLKVGVFGSNTFNKNLHTQVLAALLLPESKVHVMNKNDFSYLPSSRIIGESGMLSHSQFLVRLQEMDINLYLSFSESWGLVATESLAVGTPCLTTANSGIFDGDSFLETHLVVRDYDNVVAIKQQIESVLNNYSAISKRGIEYVAELNAMADIKLKTFLEE